MAYRFRSDESTRDACNRIVTKAMEAAASDLKPAAAHYDRAAVHRARQAVKKVRALLRLKGTPLRGKTTRADRQLRKMGRTLSGLRDADVLLDTFDTLRTRYRTRLAGSAFDALRGSLAVPARRDAERRRRGVRTAAHEAARLVRQAPRWRFEPGFKAMRPGLEAAYERARKGFEAARSNPTDDQFHEWRKRVKTHWYHMRLLAPVSGEVAARMTRLRRLQKILGLDHDLALLQSRVAATSSRAMPAVRDLLVEVITACQASQRRQALRLGHDLFKRPPQTFVKGVTAAWRRWRHPRRRKA